MMKQLVTNELERMQKVVVVALPQVLFKHLPKKAQKNPQSGQTKFEPGNSNMKQKHN